MTGSGMEGTRVGMKPAASFSDDKNIPFSRQKTTQNDSGRQKMIYKKSITDMSSKIIAKIRGV